MSTVIRRTVCRLGAPMLLVAVCLSDGAARAQQPVPRPRIISGPSAVYGRTYSPAVGRAAGFSRQAGYSAPVITPNYTVPYYGMGTAYGPSVTGPTVPYGSSVYGSPYPGYGYSAGSGYGFGYLGYGYGYPGYTFGIGQVGTTYPLPGYGYGPTTMYTPYQQMQGYYGH